MGEQLPLKSVAGFSIFDDLTASTLQKEITFQIKYACYTTPLFEKGNIGQGQCFHCLSFPKTLESSCDSLERCLRVV